eukprot:1712382-Rhodomonas_salina.1
MENRYGRLLGDRKLSSSLILSRWGPWLCMGCCAVVPVSRGPSLTVCACLQAGTMLDRSLGAWESRSPLPTSRAAPSCP